MTTCSHATAITEVSEKFWEENHSTWAEPFSLTMIVTDGQDTGGHSKLGAQLREKGQWHKRAKHFWGATMLPKDWKQKVEMENEASWCVLQTTS